MEPEIRYCLTEDGVRIAYTVTGTGSPHIFVGDPAGSHAQLAWSHLMLGPLFRELARHNTLISLDLRGCGLSDRVMPSSVKDWVLDVEAVVKRLGLKQFALTSVVSATLSMIMYAAHHIDAVTRFVIVDGWATATDTRQTPQGLAILALADIDYEMATEVIGVAAFGGGNDETRDSGAFTRAAIGPEYLKFLAHLATWDVRESCADVRCPTMILRHDGLSFVDEELTRDLAAGIPDSRMTVSHGAFATDPIGDAQRIAEFINDGAIERLPLDRPHTSAALATGTAIILFADIVDSTALTERMGDAAFRERARALDESLRAIITELGGSVIDAKTLGDGVLATFPAASQAIDAALRCGGAGNEQSLPLHLGIHAGDVIREENNVFGGAVNIASRISGLSAPGEVLVSDVVRALARTSASVKFEDRGEHALKGVGEPQRVYAVRASR